MDILIGITKSVVGIFLILLGIGILANGIFKYEIFKGDRPFLGGILLISSWILVFIGCRCFDLSNLLSAGMSVMVTPIIALFINLIIAIIKEKNLVDKIVGILVVGIITTIFIIVFWIGGIEELKNLK